MSSDPVLELTNASVVKNDRRILDGLTLTIGVGEHTAIVGPNGAGQVRSSLKLLTHEDRALAPGGRRLARSACSATTTGTCSSCDPSSASSRPICINGCVGGNSEGRIMGEAAVLSGVPRVGRHPALRRRSPTRCAGGPRTRSRAWASSHLARRWLDEMSSGEARRVLLARALVTSPRALVLDEPTTGLDLVARHDFMERVRQIAREGTTLILITHHIDEIVPEIERVILLQRRTHRGRRSEARRC